LRDGRKVIMALESGYELDALASEDASVELPQADLNRRSSSETRVRRVVALLRVYCTSPNLVLHDSA